MRLLKYLCLLSVLYSFGTPYQLDAEEDIFGNVIEGTEGETGATEKKAATPKEWTKEEISALKKQARNEFRTLTKAKDFWSALQYEHWLRSLKTKVKIKSPLGRICIGNPLYAFPHYIRHYYDHGDWIAVTCDARMHFIDVEGKPLQPSVQLPFTAKQSALTTNGQYAGCMQITRRGPEGDYSYHWRIASIDLKTQETLFHTDWNEFDHPVSTQYRSNGTIAVDGSAVALQVYGTQRKHDEIVVGRQGKPLFFHSIRDCVIVGKEGSWIIGRNTENKHWRYQSGKKHIELGPCVARHGHAAVLSVDRKKLSIINDNNKWIPVPLTLENAAQVWATDTHLIVRAGNVTVTEDDTLDIMGTVIKKGGSKTVNTNYVYLWKDLIAGIYDKTQVIVGTVQPSLLHYDSMMAYQGKILTLYDLAQEKITDTQFSHFTDKITSIGFYGNGVRVETNDQHLFMLNSIGETLWHGNNGDIQMCGPDSMFHRVYNKETKSYTMDIIRFLADGETHTTPVPLPKLDQRYGATASVFGGEVYVSYDDRNWLHINQVTDRVMRDGHVGDKDDRIGRLPMAGWRNCSHGRFNSYEGRLLPKWRVGTPQFQDIFTPYDAMYTRLGLMVTDYSHKLHRFNRKFELSETFLDKNIFWSRFAVQRKDNNTYITSWIDSERTIVQVIDGRGKFRQARADLELDQQNPEGTWRVDGSRLNIPRWGKVRWPEDSSGFRCWRMRSRDGASNLLLVTRSLIIELDPYTAKRIFPRE